MVPLITSALLEPILAELLKRIAPVITRVALDCLERGVDPTEVDFDALYGRSIAQLRAEVDRERGRTDG